MKTYDEWGELPEVRTPADAAAEAWEELNRLRAMRRATPIGQMHDDLARQEWLREESREQFDLDD
jgi:hypothetical protein